MDRSVSLASLFALIALYSLDAARMIRLIVTVK